MSKGGRFEIRNTLTWLRGSENIPEPDDAHIKVGQHVQMYGLHYGTVVAYVGRFGMDHCFKVDLGGGMFVGRYEYELQEVTILDLLAAVDQPLPPDTFTAEDAKHWIDLMKQE